MSWRNNITLFILFCIAALPLQAQRKRHMVPVSGYYTRVHFAADLAGYKPTDKLTVNVQAKASFNLGVKEEIHFFNHTAFLFGLDYLYHGVSFDSYYFADGYSVFFDKNYSFVHVLTRHELQLPLLVKFDLGREDRDPFTFYFTAGGALRYLLYNRTTINAKSNGVSLWNKASPTKFEHPFLINNASGLIQASFGGQLNNFKADKKQFFFAEMTYKYGVSRFLYTGNGTSNSIFIKDSHFLIGLGFGF